MLVTGGTGFVGANLVRELCADGHRVRVLARRGGDRRALDGCAVEVVDGDLLDPASVRAAVAGARRVYHVAADYRLWAPDPRALYRANVEGTRNVLEAMRELGIPRGVYTSTLAVFGDTHGRLVDETYRHDGPWLSEYDRTKWVAHYEVAEPMMRAGLPLVIVQPGMVYGPRDTSLLGGALRRYLRGRLPALVRGAAYCWAHVEDTARGHLLAMEKGRVGQSYVIAGPAHTLIEAFQLAERITGVPAPRLRLAPWAARAAAMAAGVIERLVPLPETYTAEGLRETAGATYIASNAKARRELGFDPRPLEVGLRETLEQEMRALGTAMRG